MEAFKKIIEMVEWEAFHKDRLETGIKRMMSRVDVVALHFLENCVSCALCKTACPYYYVDEKYSPVNKAEEARKIYRKELTFAGKILGPLVHARKPGSAEDLDRIAEFAYACTNCGACYTTCPFGIDSGVLINHVRTMLTTTGRVPTILQAFEMAELTGMYLQVPGLMQAWEETMKKAAEAIGRELPFDKEGAEIMLFPTLIDTLFTPGAVIGAIKLLDKMGADWTLPSKPLGVRPPIATVIGDTEGVKAQLGKVHEYLEKMKPKKVVLVDGGFVYPAMRWKMATVLGKRPGYKVLHLVELVYEALREGKLKLATTDDKVTWHSPCQLGRRGGVILEPEEVMRRLSNGYRPLPHHGLHTFCCGGGAGMGCMTRDMHEMMGKLLGASLYDLMGDKEKRFLDAAERRYRLSIKRKMEDIEQSGAEIVVTACPVCIHTIELGSQLYGPKVKVVHLAEYLSEHLEG